jgi:hypothetical protein
VKLDFSFLFQFVIIHKLSLICRSKVKKKRFLIGAKIIFFENCSSLPSFLDSAFVSPHLPTLACNNGHIRKKWGDSYLATSNSKNKLQAKLK